MADRNTKAVSDTVMRYHNNSRGSNNGPYKILATSPEGRTRSMPWHNDEGVTWILPKDMQLMLKRLGKSRGSQVDSAGDVVHDQGMMDLGYLGGNTRREPFRLITRTDANGETRDGIHMPARGETTGPWTGRQGRTPAHSVVRAVVASLGKQPHEDGGHKLLKGEAQSLWKTITDKSIFPNLGHGQVITETPERPGSDRVHVVRTWHLGDMPSELGDTEVSMHAHWRPGATTPHMLVIESSKHDPRAPRPLETSPTTPTPRPSRRRATASAEAPATPAPRPSRRRATASAEAPAEAPATPAPRPSRRRTASSAEPVARAFRPALFPFAVWPQQTLTKAEKPWEKPEARDKANVAKDKKKWAQARSAATKKFGKKNSYVKNMWAAKHYGKKGGKWRKGD